MRCGRQYLGYEVIREVTVGAGSVVRSPVDIHGAAAVLATLSSDLYDHVHELGEARLAVLLLEPVVEELLGLHELVLVCGHKPVRASDKLDLGMSAIKYKKYLSYGCLTMLYKMLFCDTSLQNLSESKYTCIAYKCLPHNL